ncbi:MAG: DUF4168 domain-containing protein [Nitrospirales bacterium]
MNSFPWKFATLSFLIIFTGALCLAYSATPNTQEVAYQATHEDLARNNLTPFAGAYKAIAQISNTYAQRIIQSENPIKVEALQQEAHHQMTQVVADHGLSIEDYNTIFRTIQSNSALREEFLTVLHNAQ